MRARGRQKKPHREIIRFPTSHYLQHLYAPFKAILCTFILLYSYRPFTMPKRARNAFESTSTAPMTPTHEGRKNQQHWPTPTKAKIQGTVEYLERHEIPHSKRDVFDTFGVSKRQGWAMLADNEHPRRHHNDPFKEETLGRPSKVSKQVISTID
jgi:hypothetical protein